MDKKLTARPGETAFLKGPEMMEPSPESEQILADEFPARESILEIDRRSILKLMGGSLALAGIGSLTGCRSYFLPQRQIVPYVIQPEDAASGKTMAYASSFAIGGFGTGLLVESIDGRPIKLDGNPKHPANLGSLDTRTQAQIMGIYDPDRLKKPTTGGKDATWADAMGALRKALEGSVTGKGVAILTETVGSITTATLIQRLRAKYPELKWVQYDPINRDNQREGAIMAFQKDVLHRYDFTQADVVVAIDSHVLNEGPWQVRYSRDLTSRRKPGQDQPISRLYALESHPTPVGVMSDHRARLKPGNVIAFLKALASQVGVAGATGNLPAGVDEKFFRALVADLKAKAGRSIVTVGDHYPAGAHALVHAINEALGNHGKTVVFTEVFLPASANQGKEFQELATAMAGGQVDTLMIVGGNPAFTSPGDVNFAEALTKVKTSAHLSLFPDETATKCTWALPLSHFLEAWGDSRALDGTVAIQQPLIQPLYESKSENEFFDGLLGNSRPDLQITKSIWAERWGAKLNGNALPSALEKRWRTVLSDGIVPGSAAAQITVTTVPGVAAAIPTEADPGLELVLLPHPNVFDGRYANNNWLQELPTPMTNLTWDNALLVSDATAKKLNVGQPKKLLGVPFYGNADTVTVSVNGKSVEVPVWVSLGMADDVALLHLGYGRTKAGQIGNAKGGEFGGGFDAYPLRTTAKPSLAGKVEITRTGKEYPLANTQYHNTIDASVVDSDRFLIKETTVGMLAAGKPFGERDAVFHWEKHHEGKEGNVDAHGSEAHGGAAKKEVKPPSMYSETEFDFSATNYQWAMTIDLSLCTGCNACVMACNIENNIPTVGKREVMRGREMHWIRIDRYYKGTFEGVDLTAAKIDMDNPPIVIQPVTCMHCEKAPCEPVCPVAATVHSHEGLNQMVYNRCVGTRYCSNNCPFKVRRFNFLHYTQKLDQIPVLQMLQNPDVTVRGRGVMEKCTFCVQRINKARISAKKEGREVKDGEVVTACQQACPGQAIIFGDMRKEENAVSQSRADQRNYVLLKDLNVRPRTSYLSKVRNPHPDMEA